MKGTRGRYFGVERTLSPDEVQCFMLDSNAELILLRGNIVHWEGDAIVNAANERMLGGGGVDGAIHSAAGPQLMEACRQVKEVRPSVRCPTGEARLTEGFRLPARYVIHTVGPVYANDAVSRPLLESAYKSCLDIANENGLHKIAFPAISCGVYRYPIDDAAEIALSTVAEHVGSIEEVHFVLFNQQTWKPFVKAAESMFRKKPLERE